jgi:hypothetical protein
MIDTVNTNSNHNENDFLRIVLATLESTVTNLRDLDQVRCPFPDRFCVLTTATGRGIEITASPENATGV